MRPLKVPLLSSRVKTLCGYTLHRSFRRYEIRGMSTRTYKDAIDCLNTLQSNAATLEASRASGGKLVKVAIRETVEYLGRIGYTVSTDLSLKHLYG